MRTHVDEVLGKLNADAQMVQQFRAAFGRAPDRTNFLDALVTFERSLLIGRMVSSVYYGRNPFA
jgi:cytochrome c peroxidase